MNDLAAQTPENSVPESESPRWQFSIFSLVLLSSLAAWIFATTVWLSPPYSWIAIVPMILVLPAVLLTQGKVAIGGAIGAFFLVFVGDLVIIRWSINEPEYIQSISVVAAFGFAIGASLQTMLLNNFRVGMAIFIVSLLSLVGALQL